MDTKLFRKILVLAPHTDDGELGAGGFISLLVEQGAEVHYAAFSSAEESVPDGYPRDILKIEVINATSRLGIKPDNVYVYGYVVRKLNYHRQDILDDLIALRKRVEFDLILMPSLSDIHQDHRVIAEEGLRAFKNNTIFGYELIWNNLTFNTTAFIHLSERHVEAKILSLGEYKSQGCRSYMSRKFIESLAVTRGVQIGAEYAECFEVIRLILK